MFDTIQEVWCMLCEVLISFLCGEGVRVHSGGLTDCPGDIRVCRLESVCESIARIEIGSSHIGITHTGGTVGEDGDLRRS